MAIWKIELIGGLRAIYEGNVVDRFPTKRTAALLAYLALKPNVQHAREVLAETLWPEAAPESQKHSLRLALSRLRALLGPNHPIEASRSHVWFKPGSVTTDAEAVEYAIQKGDFKLATQLLNAPLIPGHYDDWILDAQANLELMLAGMGVAMDQSKSSIPSNLRRLHGRQTDIEHIEKLFEHNAVVAITGMGGMGKTRLAIEVARTRRNPLWVSLADVSTSNHILDAVRTAARSPMPDSSLSLLAFLCRECADRAFDLIVLDNVEHLVGAELIELITALSSIKKAKILLTSRCPLALPNQAEHALKPVSEQAGAEIFMDRIQTVRLGLQIAEPVLKRIVRRLGGIPLAIELGAARVGIQSVRELELGHFPPIDDLGESLGIPERHQSLDEVLESSLEVLQPNDRQAFSDLCVFRGGFDAQAAAKVAGAELGVLERLRNHGLIVPYDTEHNGVRFRIPEPFRGIGLESMQRSDRSHALYFADWVEQNRADHLPPPPYTFGSRLAGQNTERYNVQAALKYCVSQKDPEIREAGLRIVGAFWTHWYTNNKAAEMESWASLLLAESGERVHPKIEAAARFSLALAIRERGDHRGFAEHIHLASQAFAEGESHRDAAFAWHLRGFAQSDLGAHAEADRCYAQAETTWMQLGDLRNYAVTRHNRAMVALDMNNLDSAEAYVWEALELFNLHQSTYLGVGYSTLARVFIARNDLQGAIESLRSAVHWNKRLGYVRGWAQNTRDLAISLSQLGHLDEAVALAADSLRDFRRVGDRHGEATALSALSRITGEKRYAHEAQSLISRHGIEPQHELLRDLKTVSSN